MVWLLAGLFSMSGCGKKDEGKAGGDTAVDPAGQAPSSPDPATTDSPATPGASPESGKPGAPDDAPKTAKSADKPHPADKPAPRESYHQALQRGRALFNKKNPDEAIKAFRAALEARPGDPAALSELSWVAFTQKDLTGARKAAEQSIAGTRDPIIKASSLYNLGKVEEAEGNKDAAVAAYRESFQLRQHPAVKKRLVALGAEVPESVWQATAMEGPYETIAGFCDKRGISNTEWDGSDYCNPELDSAGFDTLPPWATEAGAFESYTEDDDLPQVNLAVKTAGGWYVAPSWEQRGNRYDWQIQQIDVVGERWAIRHKNHEGRFAYEDRNVFTVCGIGASKKPSCLGPMVVRHGFTDYEGGKEDGRNLPEEVYLHCEPTMKSGDMVEIVARNAGCKRKMLAGQHTIRFP